MRTIAVQRLTQTTEVSLAPGSIDPDSRSGGDASTTARRARLGNDTAPARGQ
jgi:hypothetical protein